MEKIKGNIFFYKLTTRNDRGLVLSPRDVSPVPWYQYGRETKIFTFTSGIFLTHFHSDSLHKHDVQDPPDYCYIEYHLNHHQK